MIVFMQNKFRKFLVLLLWIAVWQIVSVLVGNVFVIVGPWETLLALFRLIREGSFFPSVGKSLACIICGFLAGSLLGGLSAALTYRFRLFKEIIEPFFKIIKTVPVVSFIILVLIWFSKDLTASLISMTVTAPVIYYNIKAGLESTDKKLLEMAEVFRIGAGRKIKYIYMPGLKPFIISSVQTAFGMAWKSGAAAEVIGQPLMTIGNGLYRGKINLATDEVLAWTVAIVAMSVITEHMLMFVVRKACPGNDQT